MIKLNYPLCLKRSLLGGQSFRWNQEGESEYIGVFANILWKLKMISNTELQYDVIGELPYPEPADLNLVRMKIEKPKLTKEKKGKLLYHEDYYKNLINSYLRLDVDLKKEYAEWKKAHKHFASNVSDVENYIAQLNQDVVENIFSFICSQNNNISRISSLVEKLCTNYGDLICEYNGKKYYAFPSLEALNKQEDIEMKLRELGFGYRAKFIQASAREIIEKGGLKWIDSLQKISYHEAHSELVALTGIGPKVADCICLMSLSFLQAVPVDTHIIQIAKNYLPDLPEKLKSMTLLNYRKIGNAFRDAYGDKAGWAQTVLFCKELVKFKDMEEDFNAKKKKIKITK